MEIALRDLRLDALTVIYPENKEYVLGSKISVTPLTRTVGDAQLPAARSFSCSSNTSGAIKKPDAGRAHVFKTNAAGSTPGAVRVG